MRNVLFTGIFILTFLVGSSYSFGQEDISPTPTPIQYELPYPGILPDNPLYKLKAVRDRLIEFLIADPLKKAEFYLLQADKRLQIGVYLIKKNQGKEDLAESTISKGENYFEKAVAEVEKAQKQGMSTKKILEKMSLATKKHKEVLEALKKETSKTIQIKLSKEKERIGKIEEKVNKLMQTWR